MKGPKRKFILLALAVPLAHAQFVCVDCATEPTQLLNNVELGLSKAELVIHTAKMIAILADAVKNSVQQGRLPGNNLQSELASISTVLQASQALNQATANLPAQWKGTWTMPTPLPPSAPGAPGFHAAYGQWAATTQASIQAAMLAGQLSHIQQQSIVGVISEIEGILSIVDGRLKAMQTTAAASTRTAASLEKMHNTMLSQGSAQQVWMQYQLQKDMQAQAIEQSFFAPATVPRDNKGY